MHGLADLGEDILLKCVAPKILEQRRGYSFNWRHNTHQLVVFMSSCRGFLDMFRKYTVRMDISFYKIPSLSLLGRFSNIRVLELDNTTVLQDGAKLHNIEMLAHCPKLETFSCEYTKVHDISVISGCPELRHLYIHYTHVTDISVLRYCNKLLELRCCHWVPDISPLQHCPDLELLCCKFSNVVDISALRFCTRLKHLNVGYTGVEDLSVLTCCPNLEELILDSDNLLSSKTKYHTQ